MYPDKFNEAVEVKKESIIDREMHRLDKTTEDIFHQAEALERRLAPLLSKQPDSESGASPREQVGELADHIRITTLSASAAPPTFLRAFSADWSYDTHLSIVSWNK